MRLADFYDLRHGIQTQNLSGGQLCARRTFNRGNYVDLSQRIPRRDRAGTVR